MSFQFRHYFVSLFYVEVDYNRENIFFWIFRNHGILAIERKSTSQNSFIRVEVLPVKRILAATSRFPSTIVPITGCERHCVWWPSTHINVTSSKLPLTLIFSIWAAFLHLKQNINSCESISKKTINFHDEEILSLSSSCDSSSSSNGSRSSTFNYSSRGSSISEDKNESSRKSGSQCSLSGHSGNMFSVKLAK